MKGKSQKKIKDILKEKGLKITDSRTAILTFLMKIGKPVVVEDIQLGIGGTTNITTIYRTLEQFTQKGIIYQADFRDGRVYYEYQTHHHHHIVCTQCGTKEEVNTCIEDKVSNITENSKKFALITDHALEFFGTCHNCTAV